MEGFLAFLQLPIAEEVHPQPAKQRSWMTIPLHMTMTTKIIIDIIIFH